MEEAVTCPAQGGALSVQQAGHVKTCEQLHVHVFPPRDTHSQWSRGGRT